MRSIFKNHRGFKRGVIVALLLVGLVIAIRLVLDPLATWATRRAFKQAKGVDGAFADVRVGVIPPSYEIERLKLVVADNKDWEKPWVYVEHVRAVMDGRALLRGMFSLALEVRAPKLRLPGGPSSDPEEAVKPFTEVLEELPELNVTRIQVYDAEVVVLIPEEIVKGGKGGKQGKPAELWIHDAEVSVENITTRKSLAQGQPVNVSMRGKMERSGVIRAFGTVDMFAEHPRFAGQFEVRGLKLSRFFDLIAPRTGLQATKGTMDAFLELSARDGRVEGGLKPVLKNLEVGAANDGWTTALKAWVVNQGVDLISDRVPGRKAVATTIPIRGDLSKPDVQVWPAVLGAIRNAFVSALASGYFNVPPAVSGEKQGPLKQAAEALTDDKPPKAQPKATSNTN